MTSILFWGVAGTMTVAVSGLMIAALKRGGGKVAEGGSSDLKVYRDQLREVERDLARGTISEAEAERLRIEIGRRVLSADKAATAPLPEQASGPRGLVMAAALLITVGAVSLGVYGFKGNPGLGDQPLQARMEWSEELRANRPSQQDMEAQMLAARPPQTSSDPRHAELMVELRRVMLERPTDLTGQELLARNEAMLGNFSASARALQTIVEVKGAQATPQDLMALAEMKILAAGELVTTEAEGLLAKVIEQDPKNPQARFYSGLMFAQAERYDLTFRFWADLWAETKAGDPWATTLEQRLPDIAWLAGQHRYEMPPLRTADTRGPDAQALASAQAMSPQERAQMIQGMVDGLMARLAEQGGSAPEWAQLIRALMVQGDEERALSIYQEAKTRFVGREADLQLIHQAASEAGLQ